VMHANYGRLRGMEIRAADDTILLRSGSAAPGTGGSLINNGDFPGEVNEAGAVEYGNGWTGSGTTSFQNGQATIGNGSWIDSEIFPLTSGETLYGELMGPSLVQGSWTLTVLAYGASKNYLGWSNASHITGAAWDAASNIAAGAVNITANSSTAYGKIRITAIGGGTQILHNAYLGKAPRRIAPSYAATYIRNGAMDTLQLAGNAVTVQDVANQGSTQTFGVGNQSNWVTIVTDSFDPAGGGYVATYTGQMNLVADARCSFQMLVGNTVVKSWVTGMRANSGVSVEGEMSSVMTHGANSTGSINTSTPVTITVQGKLVNQTAAVTVSNAVLTISGAKR